MTATREEPTGKAGTEAPFYRPELDIVRFCAFAAVFFHHALPQETAAWERAGFAVASARWLVGAVVAGGLGVDLFFVLSSYLITELLLRERGSRGAIDIRRFYLRRTLRIWPLYFAFLILVTFLLPRLISLPGLEAPWRVPFFLFLGNWATAIHGYPNSVAAPLWSVSIEEQFYIVWPLLLAKVPSRLLLPLLGLLAVLTNGARLLLVFQDTSHPGVWCNTLARLDPIVMGALIAVVLKRSVPLLSASWRLVLGLGGAAGLVVAGTLLDYSGPKALLMYPAATVFCGGILWAALGVPVPPRSRLLAAGAWLGQVSYGLYVFHMLALTIAGRVGLPLVGKIPLALVLTIIMAAVSYYLLEEPFIRLKRRFTWVASAH